MIVCVRVSFTSGPSPLNHREVSAANQQEPMLRLTELLVEFSVAASRDIAVENILRLLDHPVLKCLIAGLDSECRCHDLPKIRLALLPTEFFAVATIKVTQCPAN